MKLAIITLDNNSAGDIDLPDSIFNIEVRDDILHRMVNWQLAKRRSGTHKVKNRAEINRTSKKHGKQKGGGTARHGSMRSGIFRGGGRVFGPLVRSHEYSLTKKFKKLALRMALTVKAQSGNLLILDNISVDTPKTAEMVKHLQALNLENALLIGGVDLQANAIKAVNNIVNIDLLPVQGCNVYDILRRKKLVLSKEAAEILAGRLA